MVGRKGGVGKSTIAGNLAGEFAAMGRSVVVLDADPQHSLVAWAKAGEGMLSRSVEKVANPADTLRAAARKAGKQAGIVVIDTPPAMPEVAFQALLTADLAVLPCGPSPLDLFAVKETIGLALKARAERRSKKPRIRLVPSKILSSTNLGRSLASSLKEMGRKVLPAIGQRIVLAEAVGAGLTISEYAPSSTAHEEFRDLAKAIDKLLRE